MRATRHIFIIISLLIPVLVQSLYAQNNTIDRLSEQLAKTELDANKVDLLNDLAYEFRTNDVNKALAYALQAQDLARTINYQQGLIKSCSNLGLIYQYKGEYAESLDILQKGLKLLEAYPDDYMLARIYNNIGNLYWRTKERVLAYDYYKKALKIREELNDSLGLAKVLGNLGNTANLIMHNTDSAYYYYSRAFEIFKSLKDSSGISISYSNLAIIYKKRNQPIKAIELYNKSLEIDKQQGDLYGVTFAYSNLGNYHNELGRTDSAIYYYEKLLQLSIEMNSLPRKRQAYMRLYDFYESLEDYRKAFQYLNLYKDADDSLINQRSINRIADLQLQYDHELKEKELDLLRTKSEKNTLELSRKYWQILFLVVVLIGLAILVLALWLRFKTKNKLYKKLREQSDELALAQLVIEERNDELIAINESLEQKVGDRTQELSKAYQNLLISNQRLDHFTYRSAHDLKGPIASILGLTNLLKIEWSKIIR